MGEEKEEGKPGCKRGEEEEGKSGRKRGEEEKEEGTSGRKRMEEEEEEEKMNGVRKNRKIAQPIGKGGAYDWGYKGDTERNIKGAWE